MIWFGLAPWLLGLELAVCIGVVLLLEMEHFGWSSTLFVAGLVLCHYLKVFSVVDAFKYHFGQTMLYTLYYFLIGAGWAVLKWGLFLLRFKEERAEVLNNLHEAQEIARNRVSHRPPGSTYTDGDDSILGKTDVEFLKYKTYKVTPLNKSPKIRHYKSKFLAWMSLWVFSMIGTLLHDIVRRISVWVFNRISGVLQWMSDKMVGDFEDPPVKSETVTDDASP